MRIEYSKRPPARDGKTTFDIIHKWAKGWSVDDQAAMVMNRVFDRYPDAEAFEWFADGKGLCAGRCILGPTKAEVMAQLETR
jgi:hypothetical protein